MNRQKFLKQKRKVLAVVVTGSLFFLFGIFLYQFSIIRQNTYTDADFGIRTEESASDADGDGMMDNRDILTGAKQYLKTKPKYKSEYYEGGYLDGDYGVCADVVAFALKDAGYDLRELVAEDRKNHPERYGEDRPDSNIDFRRVRNLKVYFEYHAQVLSTDPDDLEAWRGGDIVLFPKHIGIVSDHRNHKGIPFVLHHAHPLQLHYEEDVMGSRYKFAAKTHMLACGMKAVAL